MQPRVYWAWQTGDDITLFTSRTSTNCREPEGPQIGPITQRYSAANIEVMGGNLDQAHEAVRAQIKNACRGSGLQITCIDILQVAQTVLSL